ncbi:MAG: hypothetical protein L3J07_00375 [Candidatus Magasanikbacteria bacterium]|nr:hypothetical protein [Candidatus Magasanikbacteria bacterium]
MFDKKEQKNTDNLSQKDVVDKKVEMDFNTIPDVFYGGTEPKVEFKKTQIKMVKENKTEMVDKPKQPELIQPKKVEEQKKQNKPILRSIKVKTPKKKLSILWIILIAVGTTVTIVLISWYYLNQAGYFSDVQEEGILQENTDIKIPVQIPTETVVDVIVSTTTITTTTTTEEVVEEPASLQEPALEFPSINFKNTEDLDQDNMTDLEEEVFSTDSSIWDSDQDSYYDGQELVNLYNPKGFAPVRIIDSGLVREYVNPIWKYRIYYPVVWEVASVDIDANQILISSATGEYIEIRAFKKDKTQTFLNWFSEKAVDQKFTDLSEFINRFEQDGYRRADNLVAYFIQDETVFTVVYHQNTEGNIKYRHIVEMLLQSFRYGNSVDIDITKQPLVGFGEGEL